MASLVYSTILTKTQAGPLVTISGLNTAVLNTDLKTAELNQPEGMRLVLTVTQFGQWAQWVGSQINAKFLKGEIVDPSSGTALVAWPEYSHQVAWGDDTTGTLTLRWVKGQPFAYIILGVVVALAGILLWRSLATAGWSMQKAQLPAVGPTFLGGNDPMFGGANGNVFWVPWWIALSGGAVLAATPWAYQKIVEIEQDRVADVAARRALRKEDR